MKPIILAVDDEPGILTSIKRGLRTLNVSLLLTSDVNEAQDILNNQPVNVIISDLQMPVMNGVELLKQSLKVSPDTVRIVLTGSTDSSMFKAAVNEAHISTYLTKPWEQSALLLAVTGAIEQHQLKIQKDRLHRYGHTHTPHTHLLRQSNRHRIDFHYSDLPQLFSLE